MAVHVVVLGRGVESNGTALFDSAASGDSYDRAIAAGEYISGIDRGRDIGRVIFSGAYSFIRQASGDIPERTEAQAMHTVTERKYGISSNVEVIEENDSYTTYGNFVNIARYVEPGDTLVLPIHRDHLRRAVKIGQRVLPGVHFVTTHADNTERHQPNRLSKRNDAVSALLYTVAMVGVKAGDIDTFRKRDQQLQSAVLGGLRSKQRLTDLLHQAKQRILPNS